MAHTPGPWQVRETYLVGDRAALLVADCAFGSLPDDQAEANARLIAAAPDLLAALRASETALIEAAKIIRATFPRTATLFDHHAQIARAAIVKAKGR